MRKPGSRAVPIVAPPKPEVAERKSEEAAPVKEEESKSDDQAAVVAAVPAVVVEAPRILQVSSWKSLLQAAKRAEEPLIA